MKLWLGILDRWSFHAAVNATLWAFRYGIVRFLLPATPWTPAESAWAGPINSGLGAVALAFATLSMIYGLRVMAGAASNPFGANRRGPEGPWSPFTLALCLSFGIVPAIALLSGVNVVEMALRPGTALSLAEGSHLALMFATWFCVSTAAWALYARAVRSAFSVEAA